MEDVNLKWVDMLGGGMGLAVVALALMAVVFVLWWPARAAKKKLEKRKAGSVPQRAKGAPRSKKVKD
jgi:hypothetical protein